MRLRAVLRAVDEERHWFWGDRERHHRGRMDLRAARREIVRGAFQRLDLQDEALAQTVADWYTDHQDEFLQPFPGALETLERLRREVVKLALVTNGHGPSQRRKIERFRLAGYFDCIVIEGEFGVGKPDPRVYRHVLSNLGLAAAEAWMVGDNLEWDVAGAQQAGIQGIWHDFSGTGLPPGSTVRPDRIIRSLAEL